MTGKPLFLSNHAGGILGGISTGQPVVARFAVKPTSSILHAAKDGGSLRPRHRDRDQRPARPMRWHQGVSPSARRWWHVSSPIIICAIAGRWVKGRHGHFPLTNR